MRIIATCMAANESDIVEAFVRHNLGLLDGLVVLDHRSSDRTPDILRALAQEGLPLVALRDNERAFRQGERQTAMARRYLAELDADFCFILDADEFLKVGSRGDLEAALEGLPEGHSGGVTMRNYVATSDDPPELNPVARIVYRLREEMHPARKVVLRREFASAADQHVSLGNHAAVRVSHGKVEALPHARLAGAELAHFPLRGAAQVARKVLLGWLSHRLSVGESAPGSARHWRHVFEGLASGELEVGDALMRRASSWYFKGTAGEVPIEPRDLVRDPLPVGYALRYTAPEATTPIAALATWAHQLVSDVIAARG